jgi:cysteine peptidase B
MNYCTTSLLCLIAGSALLSLVAGNETPSALFQDFKEMYGRVYETEPEEQFRSIQFSKNMLEIDHLRKANPLATFGTNDFADRTPEENQDLTGTKVPSNLEEIPSMEFKQSSSPAPTFIDWRTKGAVTAVKNQGSCGACWAFSAVETLESHFYVKNMNLPVVTLPILSPQQLVSCDTKDSGCHGGFYNKAWNYVRSVGGIETEASYPYVGNPGGPPPNNCTFDASLVYPGLSVKKPFYIGKLNETNMAAALAAIGPFSIAVDATTWNHYKGGILTSCGTSINHGVQIVGYNMGSTPPYWIVRNSWGPKWGENGYIYLQMGTNLCGLAQYPMSVQLA